MSLKEIYDAFASLEKCCLHDPQWKPIEVEKELAWVSTAADAEPLSSDSESVLVVALKDGSFGLLAESSDYTGHGCRCDAFTVREPGLGRLFTHLDDRELACLIRRPA